MKRWAFAWRRFGADLAAARARQGVTQAELAGRLGVTRQAVAAWESCRAAPSVEMLTRICSAAGLDPRRYFAQGVG